jgi:excisionase family DNA binding protein
MKRNNSVTSDTYLNVAEAARVVGVCPATIRNWCRAGLLSHIRVLRTVRIRLSDLHYCMERIVRRSLLDSRSDVGHDWASGIGGKRA